MLNCGKKYVRSNCSSSPSLKWSLHIYTSHHCHLPVKTERIIISYICWCWIWLFSKNIMRKTEECKCFGFILQQTIQRTHAQNEHREPWITGLLTKYTEDTYSRLLYRLKIPPWKSDFLQSKASFFLKNACALWCEMCNCRERIPHKHVGSMR